MDRNHRRPTCLASGSDRGATVTTPKSATLIQLLGPGVSHGGLVLSRDEYAALRRLYDFQAEGPNAKPPRPEAPAREAFASAWEYERAVAQHKVAVESWKAWTDPRPLMQAGADRNMLREAEIDGLRLLGILAKFVPPGEDPVKSLVQAMLAAGWDVDPSDAAWADAEADDAEEVA